MSTNKFKIDILRLKTTRYDRFSMAATALSILIWGCGQSRHSTPYKGLDRERTGKQLYVTYCIQCHGARADNDRGGANRRMRLDRALALSDDAWRNVVLQGRGAMPTFKERLNRDDVVKIKTYIQGLTVRGIK